MKSSKKLKNKVQRNRKSKFPVKISNDRDQKKNAYLERR